MLAELRLQRRDLRPQLLDLLAQLLDAVPLRVRQADRRVVARVVEGDDLAWHADDGRVGRHVGHDDGAGADARVLTDRDEADELRRRADDDALAQRRVALLAPVAGPTGGPAPRQVAG